MRSLYDILNSNASRYSLLESILNSDTDITSKERINELELHLRYDLFIKYVGDILWKKSPYTYSPGTGTIEFELSREPQTCFSENMYREVEKQLIEYFIHLKNFYKKDYNVSWNTKYVTAGIIYYLNFKESSKNHVVEFRVRNLRDNRRIDIVWPKNFIFMKPTINESVLDDDSKVLSETGKNKSYYMTLFAKYLIEIYKDKLDFNNIRPDKSYDYVYIPLNKKTARSLTDYLQEFKDKLTITDLLKRFVSEVNLPLINKLKKEKLIDGSTSEQAVVSAADYAFNTFKFGDLKSTKQYIFPSVGIVMNTSDITDPVKVYCIDMGDNKLHKEFVEIIKTLLK